LVLNLLNQGDINRKKFFVITTFVIATIGAIPASACDPWDSQSGNAPTDCQLAGAIASGFNYAGNGTANETTPHVTTTVSTQTSNPTQTNTNPGTVSLPAACPYMKPMCVANWKRAHGG